MSGREVDQDKSDPRDWAQERAKKHFPRSDLQAVVEAAFMEELLGFPQVTAELDRIDRLLSELAARPNGAISEEAILAERDRRIAELAATLKLTWPWIVRQLSSGLWWRQQLVQSEQRRAAEAGETPSPQVPGWPLQSIGDRRVLAAGGGPWAQVDMELAPRFVMKRGDSLDGLERRWQEISDRVESVFRMSVFSYLIIEGPPAGAPKDDVAAYERYGRWAARKLAGGESYRQIAGRDLGSDRAGATLDPGLETEPRERWREVRRGVVKAMSVLDSI